MLYVRRHNCFKLWIKRIVGDNHIENDLLVINVGTKVVKRSSKDDY